MLNQLNFVEHQEISLIEVNIVTERSIANLLKAIEVGVFIKSAKEHKNKLKEQKDEFHEVRGRKSWG